MKNKTVNNELRSSKFLAKTSKINKSGSRPPIWKKSGSLVLEWSGHHVSTKKFVDWARTVSDILFYEVKKYSKSFQEFFEKFPKKCQCLHKQCPYEWCERYHQHKRERHHKLSRTTLVRSFHNFILHSHYFLQLFQTSSIMVLELLYLRPLCIIFARKMSPIYKLCMTLNSKFN